MAKVELICELATNFGSSIPLGKEFIRRFAAAGVDTIKIQVFHYLNMRRDDPQYEWFKACQLICLDYFELRNECDRLGVGFLATAYHPFDVAIIKDLGCHRIKIGSGEAHDGAMATAVRKAKITKALVSTGLTAVEESPFSSLTYWSHNIKFLGCVTRYPAPPGIAYTMMQSGKYAGWSDHSEGLNECKAAIVGGAKIVEFHVQLPNQARPARSYEKTIEEVRELRAFADEDPYQRFVGRWNA